MAPAGHWTSASSVPPSCQSCRTGLSGGSKLAPTGMTSVAHHQNAAGHRVARLQRRADRAHGEQVAAVHGPHGHPLLFQSLRHGTETTGDLSRSADPAIQALFEAFDAPIREYFAHIGHGHDPRHRRNHVGRRFNDSWSVRLRSSGHHSNHVHPRGWISCTGYVDVLPHAGRQDA